MSSLASISEHVSSDDLAAATIRRIISGEEPMRMFHQPIVDLVRGIATGYEALVRFPAELGDNPLRVFVRARRLGFRLELEKATFLASVATRSMLPANCFLSVNASPLLLLSDDWIQAMAQLDDLTGTVIEVTEMDSIHDYDAIRLRLNLARELGAIIAVDDAGAGYASLQHIVELKPSFIKLDRMFITNCHDERAKSALIEMLGHTASRLDAWIIAEGIETAGELDTLIQLGVPLGQGYHLGNPAPGMHPVEEGIVTFIHSRRAIYASTEGLHHLIQALRSDETPHRASDLLARETTLGIIAVIDQWKRPVEFVERHPLLGIRRVTQLMKVQASSSPSEVAHRALTRPPASRFDPIMVINQRGELEGMIPVDRLMRSLLT